VVYRRGAETRGGGGRKAALTVSYSEENGGSPSSPCGIAVTRTHPGKILCGVSADRSIEPAKEGDIKQRPCPLLVMERREDATISISKRKVTQVALHENAATSVPKVEKKGKS